jgi:ComF family protein
MGIREAVFSSSGDRIRAAQAKAAVAGISIASVTGHVAESLFAVLFPSDCRICGLPLVRFSRLPICQECLDGMQRIAGGVCSICGERLFSAFAVAGAEGEPRCGLCRRIEPAFARAVAYGSYESGLRELIHLLKYGGVRPAANVLGRMLAEAIATLEPELPEEGVAVVPVPLHRLKFRERGFNQAELIARAALKLNPVRDRLSLCPAVLVRKRETPSQTGLTSHQRRENLRGAFGVVQPGAVKGRGVLVVDDVYTTGATVSECARVLRRAGATQVWVATVARTLKVSAQHVEIRPGDVEALSNAFESTDQVALARAAAGS